MNGRLETEKTLASTARSVEEVLEGQHLKPFSAFFSHLMSELKQSGYLERIWK